jgi:hypothetical protein
MTVWAAAQPADDRAGTVEAFAAAAASGPSGTSEKAAARAASAVSVSGLRARIRSELPATAPLLVDPPGQTVAPRGGVDQASPRGLGQSWTSVIAQAHVAIDRGDGAENGHFFGVPERRDWALRIWIK